MNIHNTSTKDARLGMFVEQNGTYKTALSCNPYGGTNTKTDSTAFTPQERHDTGTNNDVVHKGSVHFRKSRDLLGLSVFLLHVAQFACAGATRSTRTTAQASGTATEPASWTTSPVPEQPVRAALAVDLVPRPPS